MSIDEWRRVIELCEGVDTAETLNNLYNFILQNYNFDIKEGAEGVVYFGSIDYNNTLAMFKVVDGLTEKANYGYISSTKGGELFNDQNFQEAVRTYFDSRTITGSIWDGIGTSGEILFEDNSVGTAFNDFFSYSYVNNLKCENVVTMLSGTYEKGEYINAFSRTEFNAIIDNASIKTINGIDKNIFSELYYTSPKGKEMEYVCDVIKMSQTEGLKELYFKTYQNSKNETCIKIINKSEDGAIRLIDSMISGDKLSNSSIEDIIKNCAELSKDTKKVLQNISKKNMIALNQIINEDIEEITKLYVEQQSRGLKLVCDRDGNYSLVKNSVEIDKSKFSISIEDYRKLPSEADIIKEIPDYSDLDSVDKLKVRDIKRKISDLDEVVNSDNIKIKEKYVDQYNDFLKEHNINIEKKTLSNIDDFDDAVIKITNIDTKSKSFLDEIIDEYKSLDTPGKKILKGIDVITTVYDIYKTVETVVEECKDGDYEGVTKTIYSYATTESIGFLMGEAFIPAFAYVGAAFGPVGMVIGGAIGAIACGVLAGEFSEMFWNLGESISDLWDTLFGSASSAQPPRDPLAIDLGKLGIELTSVKDGVHFDLDKNGFAEKTAWIGTEDGFLVFDRNGNGIIDDGGELFGDQVTMSDGRTAVSGFEALKDLDSNNDGIIDENDEAWSKLRVWVDANHDGE